MAFFFYLLTGFAIASVASMVVECIVVPNDVKTNNLRNFPSFLTRNVNDFDFNSKNTLHNDKNGISFMYPEIIIFKNSSSFRNISVLPENTFIERTAFNDLKAYMNFKVGILQRQAARNEVNLEMRMEKFEKRMEKFEKRMHIIESSMQIIKDNHKLQMQAMYEKIHDFESGGSSKDQEGD